MENREKYNDSLVYEARYIQVHSKNGKANALLLNMSIEVLSNNAKVEMQKNAYVSFVLHNC